MNTDEHKPIRPYSPTPDMSPEGGNGSAVTKTTTPEKTKLSMKHEKFCQEYLVDMVGFKAAERSGFSGDTAYSLLARDDIQARLAEIQAEVMQRTSTDQNYVVVKLRNWSDSKITDYFDIVGRGKKKRLALKDLSNLPGYVIDCIQEIRQAKDGSISIKFVDKRGAATDIGRHLGMFSDNLIVTPLSFEDLMLKRAKDRAQQEEANK